MHNRHSPLVDWSHCQHERVSFWCPVNTIMTIHCSMKLELDLIRPHNLRHKLFILIYHLLKPLTKLHSAIRIIVIYYVNNVWMYTFHLKAFRMHRTLELLTRITCTLCSRHPWWCCKPFKTTDEEARLVTVRGLPDLPLCTSQMVPCVSNLSQSPVIVKCAGGCVWNSRFHWRWISATFSNWIIIIKQYVAVWCLFNRRHYSHD